MRTDQIADRYARALYDLAVERQAQAEVSQALERLQAALDASPELEELWHDPRLSAADKGDILNEAPILESRVTLAFLRLLIVKGRIDYLRAIIQRYQTLALGDTEAIAVTVTSAVELTAEEENNLVNKLTAQTGRPVSLTREVDAKIIGGLVVRIGDRVYDGSIAGRLARLKDRLQEIHVSELGVKE